MQSLKIRYLFAFVYSNFRSGTNHIHRTEADAKLHALLPDTLLAFHLLTG